MDSHSSKSEISETIKPAEVDFSLWSKMPWWTLDEAICLSLGREPSGLTWYGIKQQADDFALHFERRRQLSFRLKVAGELDDPIAPPDFVEWAKNIGLSVPQGLETAVAMRSQGVNLRSMNADLQCALREKERELEDKEALLEWLRGDMQVYRSQIEELKKCQPEAERPLGTRERSSLVKLFIGLAVVAYRFDSNSTRSEVTSEIQRDLASLGIDFDLKTIRKFLKEGAEYLPLEKNT